MQSGGYYRWVLMGAAVCVKMVISIYQYSWFLFAFTITEQEGWSLEQVGLTFTVLILAATLIQPFSGMYADASGPRRPCLLAACLVGAGMLAASYASSPLELCLYYGMGGLGVGALNGISTATALKWFPRKRGLATGVVEFGFGAGHFDFQLFSPRQLGAFRLAGNLLVSVPGHGRGAFAFGPSLHLSLRGLGAAPEPPTATAARNGAV